MLQYFHCNESLFTHLMRIYWHLFFVWYCTSNIEMSKNWDLSQRDHEQLLQGRRWRHDSGRQLAMEWNSILSLCLELLEVLWVHSARQTNRTVLRRMLIVCLPSFHSFSPLLFMHKSFLHFKAFHSNQCKPILSVQTHVQGVPNTLFSDACIFQGNTLQKSF